MTLFFIFLFPASASNGEFYKWVDKKGSVHFTDEGYALESSWYKIWGFDNMAVRETMQKLTTSNFLILY